MPQSLARILVHLVFSTKNREPFLSTAMQRELHPYLAGILDNLDCPSMQVGGVEDHVHLLFGLSRTRTIAEVVENLKTSSSKWTKLKGAELGRSRSKPASSSCPAPAIRAQAPEVSPRLALRVFRVSAV